MRPKSTVIEYWMYVTKKPTYFHLHVFNRTFCRHGGSHGEADWGAEGNVPIPEIPGTLPKKASHAPH